MEWTAALLFIQMRPSPLTIYSTNSCIRSLSTHPSCLQIWNHAGHIQHNILVSDGSGVACVRFNAARLRIFSGSFDGELRFMDLATGQVSTNICTALQLMPCSIPHVHDCH